VALPFELNWPSFFFGIALVVLLGFGVFVITWAGQYLGAPFQPQKVVHKTEKTPWQVTMGCLGSFLLTAGLAVALVAVLVMTVLKVPWSEITFMLVVAAASLLAGLFIRSALS
jgi:hypothetical protein